MYILRENLVIKLLLSPLNSYLYVVWILDFTYILNTIIIITFGQCHWNNTMSITAVRLNIIVFSAT